MRNQFVGKKGEDLAVLFFKEKGFTIQETNWRFSRFEIDLIATSGDTIHFIEVKTRTSALFGYPEESVTAEKFQKILNAAEAFLEKNKQWKKVQYDVLAITMLKNKPPEYHWLEDFYI